MELPKYRRTLTEALPGDNAVKAKLIVAYSREGLRVTFPWRVTFWANTLDIPRMITGSMSDAAPKSTSYSPLNECAPGAVPTVKGHGRK